MGKCRPALLYRRGNRKDAPMSEKTNNAPAVADALNALLADSFALYLKTKNYHWHVQGRSEEHTSELQSLMRISYAVFCLKKKKTKNKAQQNTQPYISHRHV